MPLTKATQNVIEGIVSTGSTGVSAGSFQVGQQYKITSLGTTTQSQWNTIAGTTGQTYVVGSMFTAATTGAGSGTGAAAVARTLANRFADVVNVKDFGAVGDGVTDDTAAIQAALDFGGTIHFPDGVYISETLNIGSDTYLALSNGAVLKAKSGYMTSGTGNMLLDITVDSSNVSITGGTIDGNLSAGDLAIWPNAAGNSVCPLATVPNLVYVRSVDNISFTNVRFVNTIASCLRLFGTLGTNESTNFKVVGCYFDNVLGNCIYGAATNLIVSDCIVNLIGDIRGTNAGGTLGGFFVGSTFNAIIADNSIRQTTDSSIYIVNDPGGNVSVTGNVITYSGKDAIKVLESSSNVTITGNVIVASGKSCIGIFDNGTNDKGDSIIANNIVGYVNTPTNILDPLNNYAVKTITGCTNQSSLWVGSYDSVAIGTAASNLIVDGNKISNVLGPVFNPTEQNISIINNKIVNATGPAAIIQSSYGCNFSNNIIENVGSNAAFSFNSYVYGIFINGVNENIIINNNIIRTTGADAVYSDDFKTFITISGNQFYDWNGAACIYLNGTTPSSDNANNIVISGNVMNGTDTTIRGIYLRDIRKAIVTSNSIKSVSDGIRISDCGDMVVSNNSLSQVFAVGIFVDDSTVSAAINGNIIYDAVTYGILTSINTANVTAFGNIGLSCGTASMSISGTTVKPATISSANI